MLDATEKAKVAARINAIQVKLDTLNTAVQNGQVLIALLREVDLGKDLSELLIDLAYSAGT